MGSSSSPPLSLTHTLWLGCNGETQRAGWDGESGEPKLDNMSKHKIRSWDWEIVAGYSALILGALFTIYITIHG